jgi:serine/threonine protein kinase
MDWLSGGTTSSSGSAPAPRIKYGSSKFTSAPRTGAQAPLAPSHFSNGGSSFPGISSAATTRAPPCASRASLDDDASFFEAPRAAVDADDALSAWSSSASAASGAEFVALLASAARALARAEVGDARARRGAARPSARARLAAKLRGRAGVVAEPAASVATAPARTTGGAARARATTSSSTQSAAIVAPASAPPRMADSDSDDDNVPLSFDVNEERDLAERADALRAAFRRVSLAPAAFSRRSTLGGAFGRLSLAGDAGGGGGIAAPPPSVAERAAAAMAVADAAAAAAAAAATLAVKPARKTMGGPRRVLVSTASADALPSVALPPAPTPPSAAQEALSSVLTAVLEFSSDAELRSVVPLVARSWGAVASTVLALRVARAGAGAPRSRAWKSFLEVFPWGAFLARGAYKSVFRVWCSARRAWEAVSVMDARAIAASGPAGAALVANEVTTACLASHLVRTRVAPNFVTVHSAFLHASTPVGGAWAGVWSDEGEGAASCPFSADLPGPPAARAAISDASSALADRARAALAHVARAPRAVPVTRHDASHLFIRQELCVGGDVESYLRGLESGVAAAEAAVDGAARNAADVEGGAFARSLTFQMAFSLYAARERLRLRHGDVKLLNYLLAAAPSAEERALRYAFGDRVFTLELQSTRNLIAKLADFGSSTTLENEGAVTPAHWTTVENAPPEFFVEGDGAPAGFGADTWALGLCVLHALVGAVPYEEAMAGVTAPRAWARSLTKEWTTGGAHAVLNSVVGKEDEYYSVLADTVWRIAVLLRGSGVPPAPRTNAGARVHALIALLHDVGAAPPASLLPVKARKEAVAAFAQDTRAWSLASGDAPLLVRARRRAATTPNLWSLLKSLLSWDASERPTMRAVLESAAFAPLETSAADANTFNFYGGMPLVDV